MGYWDRLDVALLVLPSRMYVSMDGITVDGNLDELIAGEFLAV